MGSIVCALECHSALKEENVMLCDDMATAGGHCAGWSEAQRDKHSNVSVACGIQVAHREKQGVQW